MAKKVYDTDGLDMRNTKWDGDVATEGNPVSGRLVENYIKSIDDKAKPTEELVHGETKAPTSGAVFDAMVGTVTDIDVRDSADGTQYVMTVKQKDETGLGVDKEVRFSKYTDDDKVVINVDLTDSNGSELPSSQYLPSGSSFVVKYSANVGTAGGGVVDGYTDLKAKVVVKRGSVVMEEFQHAAFVGIKAGESYTFDASTYIKDAMTYTVQVEAQATYLGETLNKAAAARVTMVAMSMETTYSVGNGLENGGYKYDANIPFTIKGTSGEKNIYYRINGGLPFTLGLSAGSGYQQKNVTIPLSSLKEGSNVVEAYAIHEHSGVMSTVYYITLLKAGNSVESYAGLMFSHRSDNFQADYLRPVLNAEQFSAWNIEYAGYDKASRQAPVRVSQDGVAIKEDKLFRGETGSYGRTNVGVDPMEYSVSCGSASIGLTVNTQSHPDIEASLASDADCSFDAFGRSNSEINADVWTSGNKRMEFNDVLWSVNKYGVGSGWFKDRLLLSGGASMRLTADGGYHPFNDGEKPVGYSIQDSGMTLEIEYSTDNVTDVNAELISCLGTLSNGNRYGLLVTPEEAKFLTGVKTEAQDGGDTITYEDSIGTKFQPNTNIRITYVFYPDVESNEQRTLIGFYVNGEESAASKWVDKVNFDIMKELTFNSSGADLRIKSVRVYNKALSSDEVLNNYIVDRNHLEDTDEEQGVRSLDTENRVMDERFAVSIDKLMVFMEKRHNSILVLIGTGSVDSEVPSPSDTLNIMDALAQLNNKKANKLCREVRFYNGENRKLDFIARNCFVRIQGTSSVNYARKNIRFYFQKTAQGYTATMSYGEIGGNGQQSNPTQTESKGNFFKLRENSIGAKLACAKCDYSDSSMTTNTGGAKFINDGLKEMGILTPAQKYVADHPSCNDDVRSAIDGMPCDLFVAKSVDDDLIYYGQYNMNNEKSDSYPVFGQDKSIGGETWGTGDTLKYLVANESGQKEYLPICIETLNNGNDLCLFHWLPSTESNHTDFMDKNFDGGFEFNHPKDVFWHYKSGDRDGKFYIDEHLGTGDEYEKRYKAVDRMMSFIYRCVKETPIGKILTYNPVTHTFDGINYDDVDGKFPKEKWLSPTFKKDAEKYFNVPNLIAYYLYVQFNLAVDQLAKNMLLRTWDGVMWYITYYDGDCQLGSDNKSFLTGKYNDNRETIRDGSYVMQGHNSWLWNLVLGNMQDMMETAMKSGLVNDAASFMSAFSIQKAVDHFDREQMSKWCSRLYNKSGIFKYVFPFLNPMPLPGGTSQTYPQIYGLKGSLKQHRKFFIERRYDLKQVEYGYFPTSGSLLYQSAASFYKGYILNPLQVTLTIPYRVQLKSSNQVHSDTGVIPADTVAFLKMSGSANENDPLNIIGSQKIKTLVWHEDAFAIGFNFSLMTSLVKLDMSVEKPSGYRNGSYMVFSEGLALLEEMDMRNNLIARNGDNGNIATLDLSRQSRLRILDLRGTGLTRLTLATGTPLVQLSLPDSIEELFLEDLTKLTNKGLVLEGINNIRGFRFNNCPGIDGLALFDRLHQAKKAGTGKLERFSIAIDTYNDGSILEEYFNYGTYTESGAVDNSHSGLKGSLHLTKSMSDENMARYEQRYPELNIIQAPYTMIEFDDSVADSANITNLDNNTGYNFANQYVPSAHINKILSQRHRVLGKKTADGVMTICQLHDEDSNYYADNADKQKATQSVLTGEQGDVFVYEPHYWYKGINDLLNKKKYSCFSSNKECPSSNDYHEKIMLSGITKKVGFAMSTESKFANVNDAKVANNEYTLCKVEVNPKQYKQVRFPSILHATLGAVLADAEGKIIKRMVPEYDCGLIDGMYCFTSIPSNAATLYFTIANDADFDYVLLTSSNKVEDIEPDWVEHKEYLCGVYEGVVRFDTRLYSLSGELPNVYMSQKSSHDFSAERGLGYQSVDWEMHKDVANLFYAKYGERNVQIKLGYGSFYKNNLLTGLTNQVGMIDTFANPDNPTAENSAYIWTDKENGVKENIRACNCLGYENWYGHRSESLDNILCRDRIIEITRNDGILQKIPLIKVASNFWIKSVYHGRYMDIFPTLENGSDSTYYCDMVQYSNRWSVVALSRSSSSGKADEGLSSLEMYTLPSGSDAFTGSRLAFRGTIVEEQDVQKFINLENLN